MCSIGTALLGAGRVYLQFLDGEDACVLGKAFTLVLDYQNLDRRRDIHTYLSNQCITITHNLTSHTLRP